MNRVWTYIISRELNEHELNHLIQAGQQFVVSWTAHEVQLHATFEIFNNRIIIVKVNEDIHGASGCSIDKLTRFIKDLEIKFEIELLNRLLVAYKDQELVRVVNASKVKELLSSNILNKNTLIFDTSVSNEKELNEWEKPLNKSWLSKFVL